MRPVTCQCSKVLSVEDLAPSHSRAQCVCVLEKRESSGEDVGRRASHRSSHVSHISLKSSMSPAPAYLGLGLIAAVSIGLIIYAHARPAPEPLAPISVWYEVPTCSNATASASGGQQVAALTACAEVAEQGSSWPGYRLPLSLSDGYLPGTIYSMTLLLQTGAYVVSAVAIEDGRGAVLSPVTNLELGPDLNFPWRIKSPDMVARSLPAVSLSPPPAPAPQRPSSPPAAWRAKVDGVVDQWMADQGGDSTSPPGRRALSDAAPHRRVAQNELETAAFEFDDLLSEWVDDFEGDLLSEWVEDFEGEEDEEESERREAERGLLSDRRRGGGSRGGSRSSYSSSRSRSSTSSSSSSRSRSSYSSSSPSSSRSRTSSPSSSRSRTSSSSSSSSRSRASYYSSSAAANTGYAARPASYGGHYPGYATSYPSVAYGRSPYMTTYAYGSPYYYSPAMFYYPYGMPFYVGGPMYHYNAFSHAMMMGMTLSIMSNSHHHHYHDDDGDSDSSTGESRGEVTLEHAQDRYDLTVTFTAPAADGASWPCYVVVYNTTVFAGQGTVAAAQAVLGPSLYVSFAPAEAPPKKSMTLATAGYVPLA